MFKKYTTELWALDPQTGELKLWVGPHILATSFTHARQICDTTGKGYLDVTGEFISEIDEEENQNEDFIFWA